MIRMNTPDYGFSKRNKRRESLGGTPSKYVDMVANIYDEVMLRSAAKKRGSKKNSAMRSAMMTIPGAPIDIQKEINRNKRRHRRIKGDTAYDLANKSIYGIVNPYTA